MGASIDLKTFRKSLVGYGLGFGGILLFLVLFVYPNQQTLDAYQQQIDKLAYQLKAQEILYPLYQQLSEELDRLQEMGSTPLPLFTELDCQTQQIFSAIQQIGQSNGFSVLRLYSDAGQNPETAEAIHLNIIMTGEYLNFPEFYSMFIQIPCITEIDRIQIEESEASVKRFSIDFRITRS